jgi:hypothetical protein
MKIGESVFIDAGDIFYIGKVAEVSDMVTLSSVSIIWSMATFSEALENGSGLHEVEKIPNNVMIPLGRVRVVYPWKHKL